MYRKKLSLNILAYKMTKSQYRIKITNGEYFPITNELNDTK